jgi:hypothetical protein
MRLTEEQWQLVGSILPADVVREDGGGRPWSDRRKAFEGALLWKLRTGAPWPSGHGRGDHSFEVFMGRLLVSLTDDFLCNRFGEKACTAQLMCGFERGTVVQ